MLLKKDLSLNNSFLIIYFLNIKKIFSLHQKYFNDIIKMYLFYIYFKEMEIGGEK